jgi:hypothetical protein
MNDFFIITLIARAVWRYCPLYRAQIKTILIVFVLYLCPYKHRTYLKKSSLIAMQRDSYPFGSETQRFHQLAWDSLKLLNASLPARHKPEPCNYWTWLNEYLKESTAQSYANMICQLSHRHMGWRVGFSLNFAA